MRYSYICTISPDSIWFLCQYFICSSNLYNRISSKSGHKVNITDPLAGQKKLLSLSKHREMSLSWRHLTIALRAQKRSRFSAVDTNRSIALIRYVVNLDILSVLNRNGLRNM